jgi:hypothetical protein
VTDLNASSTYASPDVRRSRAGRTNGFWRRANNTFGAMWELNGVPPPPLHIRCAAGRKSGPGRMAGLGSGAG